MGIVLLFSYSCFAQLNNEIFKQTTDFQKDKKLSFVFQHLSFLKNDEYFTPLYDGFTLFGQQYRPELSYTPTPNVTIQGGVYAQKDFGNKQFSTLVPTFTVKFRKDSTQFLFGTLEGATQHRLVEPLYNFERVLNNRLENGIQLTRHRHRYYLDTWLDWQRMTYKGADFQEEIWGGLHLERLLWQHAAQHLQLVVQTTAKHKGGQINTGGQIISTTLNTALGLKWQHQQKHWNVEGYWLGASTDDPSVAISQGQGLYLNVSKRLKPIEIMLSYWQGSGYANPTGGDLYQSVSTNMSSTTYTEKERKLLIIRLLKNWKVIPSLQMAFRFEPYYDFVNHRLEHSEGLYLAYILKERL